MKTHENKRAIELVSYSLSKDISKKMAKGVTTTNFREYISRKNNKDREMLIGSSIPFAISIGGVALGIVTLGLSSLTNELVANQPFIIDTMNVSKDAIKNMGSLSIFNLSVPAVTALLTDMKLKRKTERYNCRLYSKDELEDIKRTERAKQFIIDLKSNQDDKSLEFAKDFLSSVLISKNTKDYNKELLMKLSEHRESILEENEEQEKVAYEEFIKFLMKSKTTMGASKEFLETPKVQLLIKEFVEKKEERRLVKKK